MKRADSISCFENLPLLQFAITREGMGGSLYFQIAELHDAGCNNDRRSQFSSLQRKLFNPAVHSSMKSLFSVISIKFPPTNATHKFWRHCGTPTLSFRGRVGGKLTFCINMV